MRTAEKLKIDHSTLPSPAVRDNPRHVQSHISNDAIKKLYIEHVRLHEDDHIPWGAYKTLIRKMLRDFARMSWTDIAASVERRRRKVKNKPNNPHHRDLRTAMAGIDLYHKRKAKQSIIGKWVKLSIKDIKNK